MSSFPMISLCKLIFFSLISIISILIGLYAFSPAASVTIIKNIGYWYILLVFLLFCHSLYIYFKCSKEHFILLFTKNNIFTKQTFFLVFFFIGAILFIQIHEPTEFKIIMDEPVLAGTAMNMHKNREVMTPIRAHHMLGVHTLLGGYVDKRPLLFPFLVSVLHDFTGYRINNSFILNFILLGFFLILLYSFSCQAGNHLGGISSILLILTLPLFYNTSNGGGFELLNMSWILLTMMISLVYLNNSNKANLSFLCLAAILLAQVRYESVIYLVPVGIIILYGWFKEKRIITSWAFFVSPILLIPYLWQHRVFEINKDFWQLSDIPTASTPFSLKYMYTNIGHAMNFFFDATLHIPNSFIISALGTFCLVFFIIYIIGEIREKKKTLSPPIIVFSVFLLGFFLYFLILLTYFYGQLDNSIIQRLSLPLHLPLIIAVSIIVFGVIQKVWLKKALIGLICTYIILFTIPALAVLSYSKSYLPSTEIAWINDFVKNHSYNKEPYMVISELSTVWILNGIDAISPSIAKDRKAIINYYLNTPNNPKIYLYETHVYDYETKTYKPKHPFDPDFITKPYLTCKLSNLRKTELKQVIKIANIDPDFSEVNPTNDEEYLLQWAKNLP